MNAVIVCDELPRYFFVKPVRKVSDNQDGQVVDIDEATWKRWESINALWQQMQDELQDLFDTDPPPESDE